MFKSGNFPNLVAENLVIILLWHLVVLALCKMLSNGFFDYNKYIYKIKSWENNGFFYSKRLKIKLWKDLLPQYVSNGGFSKKNLDSLSLEYVDRFILETCRGEWAHRRCMLVALLMLVINRLLAGVVFGTLVVFVNLPFVCIQRYNRIRLLRVREKLLRQDHQKAERLIGFVKRVDAIDSH